MKIRINKNMLLAFIYIVMLCIMFFNKSKIIILTNMQKNLIEISIFIITTIILILKRKYVKEKIDSNIKDKAKIIKILIVLYVVMLINSIIVITNRGYKVDLIIEDAVITIGMFMVSLLLANNTDKIFNEKNLKYIFYAGIINYVLMIIFFTIQNGIEGLINFRYLNEQFIDTSLEVHELTFIFGLILTYLFTSKFKISKFQYVILILFLYMGYKRIITGALIAVLFFYILQKIFKNKKIVLRIMNFSTIAIVCIYLFFSSVGLPILESLSEKIGVNLMGRNELYEFFEGKYELSYNYFGRGLRSTDMLIRDTPSVYGYTAIHNDILRIYIENGIYVFLLYFVVLIFVIPRVLEKRYSITAAVQYSYLILYTVVCYMTDNLFSYYRYLFVFFALLFLIVRVNKQKKEEENYEQIN